MQFSLIFRSGLTAADSNRSDKPVHTRVLPYFLLVNTPLLIGWYFAHHPSTRDLDHEQTFYQNPHGRCHTNNADHAGYAKTHRT